MVQWLRLRAPNAGGPGLIPDQGTRSHMHAATKSLRATTKSPHAATKILHVAVKIPRAATKIQHSQVNK